MSGFLFPPSSSSDAGRRRGLLLPVSSSCSISVSRKWIRAWTGAPSLAVDKHRMRGKDDHVCSDLVPSWSICMWPDPSTS